MSFLLWLLCGDFTVNVVIKICFKHFFCFIFWLFFSQHFLLVPGKSGSLFPVKSSDSGHKHVDLFEVSTLLLTSRCSIIQIVLRRVQLVPQSLKHSQSCSRNLPVLTFHLCQTVSNKPNVSHVYVTVILLLDSLYFMMLECFIIWTRMFLSLSKKKMENGFFTSLFRSRKTLNFTWFYTNWQDKKSKSGMKKWLNVSLKIFLDVIPNSLGDDPGNRETKILFFFFFLQSLVWIHKRFLTSAFLNSSPEVSESIWRFSRDWIKSKICVYLNRVWSEYWSLCFITFQLFIFQFFLR